jgi:PmbA protein
MDSALLHELVDAALKGGADAAEAVGAERRSLSITVRLGALEEIEREESRDLGLRVFIGQRQAVVSGSDLSAAARARLVERAVAMARLAPEDPYAGLAPGDRLARGPLPALDLYDPTEPTADQLERAAQAAEGRPPGVQATGGWSPAAGSKAPTRGATFRSTPRPSRARAARWRTAAMAALHDIWPIFRRRNRSARRPAGALCLAWALARSPAAPRR